MTAHALHSSKRQDWQTPAWLLEHVRRVGPIALDPATTVANPTAARMFYAPGSTLVHGQLGTCGLAGQWPLSRDGLTWINPPYGGALPVWAERIARHEGERICLVPNRTEVGWFETLHAASYARAELLRRVAFVDATTGLVGPSPNHGSVLFYSPGPRGREGLVAFVAAFHDIARILPGGKRL